MCKKILVILAIAIWAAPAFAEVYTVWERRYNGLGSGEDGARDIAVDRWGNVFVTGYVYIGTAGLYDYATVSYDFTGRQRWIREYSGAEDKDDRATALAVDDSGYVYVTGFSWGDASTRQDWATLKYDGAGNTSWERRYDAASDWDYASDVAVDGSHNVYVTGWCDVGVGVVDYTTVKYYPNGETAWVRTYDGTGHGTDEAHAIAVDDSGSVYVTGMSWDDETWFDMVTIKYYTNGDTAWIRRHNGSDGLLDQGKAIAVDGCGDVYVSGMSYEIGTEYDYCTIKYDSEGNEVWVRTFHEWNGESASSVGVDASGNVYVAGTRGTIKYGSDGSQLWKRPWGSAAVALDTSGSVFVIGASHSDYETVMYLPDGDTAWTIRYDGPGHGTDACCAIALGDGGHVYVTGTSYGGSDDFATIKYVFGDVRGDANGDGAIDISDVVYIIDYLFRNGPAPSPPEAGDTTCDGRIDIADVVSLINYLLKDGPAPGC